jgi:hypothetical protein
MQRNVISATAAQTMCGVVRVSSRTDVQYLSTGEGLQLCCMFVHLH